MLDFGITLKPDLYHERLVALTRQAGGEAEARRDPATIKVRAAAPVWVSDDLATARDRVRWFPALVSNCVMDLIARYDSTELPAELTAYVRDRARYDYHHHAEVGSTKAAFVAEQRRRLQELVAADVN